jgi:hypothetical protein
MFPRQLLLSVCVLGLMTWPAAAVSPPVKFPRPEAKDLLPLLSSGTPDALAGSLRGYLVRSLPDPLYEASPGWGQTKKAPNGVKWTGKVVPLRPEITQKEKNQGTWRKVRVTAVNPADSLVLDLRDFRSSEQGRLTFTAFVALDARVDYTRQKWEAGLKLSDISVRARFRVQMTLNCEATLHLTANGLLLPEAVFRLRVVESHVQFENFVVEHVAGVGGDAAKFIGDRVKHGLDRWHPSLEQKLLERANAAIVKAGDTKEVRLSLTQLLKKAK